MPTVFVSVMRQWNFLARREQAWQMCIRASFYYTYTGADGKNYAVLIIPFKDGYQNHKIKIKYFTDLNSGGLSVEAWLDKNNDQPKNLANDVKFLWKWFRYGDGPEWTDFTWDIDLRKEVNTSVTLGRKNAGIYNESTQMLSLIHI